MIPLLPPFLLLSLLPCLLISFGGVVDKAEPAATLSPPCALSLFGSVASSEDEASSRHESPVAF